MNRNVVLLSLCQALLTTGNVLLVSVNGLIGLALAPSMMLITLPVALQFVGLMSATIPASLIMRRVGRKNGFFLGTMVGIIGALVCIVSLNDGQFYLFCAGTFLVGIGIGFGTLYRFAAVEVCPDGQQSRAISLVMAGGVVAAILGPTLALHSKDLFDGRAFVGSFVGLLIIYIVALFLLIFTRIPHTPTPASSVKSRPVKHFLKQRDFMIAVVAGMVSYAVMNLIMTATPMAMDRCGFSFAATTDVIKWHVLGMFAPAFFTGRLIERFGAKTLILIGAILNIACIVINLLGVSEWHFWSALLLLGLGWNFMFISATQLLTTLYRETEKAKIQATNEFLVFFSVTLSALSSGWLEASVGWFSLNLMMLPVVLLVIVLLIIPTTQNQVISTT